MNFIKSATNWALPSAWCDARWPKTQQKAEGNVFRLKWASWDQFVRLERAAPRSIKTNLTVLYFSTTPTDRFISGSSTANHRNLISPCCGGSQNIEFLEITWWWYDIISAFSGIPTSEILTENMFGGNYAGARARRDGETKLL